MSDLKVLKHIWVGKCMFWVAWGWKGKFEMRKASFEWFEGVKTYLSWEGANSSGEGVKEQ